MVSHKPGMGNMLHTKQRRIRPNYFLITILVGVFIFQNYPLPSPAMEMIFEGFVEKKAFIHSILFTQKSFIFPHSANKTLNKITRKHI